MPTNLPPNYYRKERELKFAHSPEEKIQIYLELLAIMPKHKGTDKLKADIRGKISRLKRELGKKSFTARFDFYHVPREGAAQVVLLGQPNTGKSQILKALTNAEPEVHDYPFTTQKPQVGMILYDNIQIQLVDMPPISNDYAPGWIFGIARGSDIILLVLNLGKEDIDNDTQSLLNLLETAHIKVTMKDEEISDEHFMLKKSIFLCNKEDLEGAALRLKRLMALYDTKFRLLSISALKGTGIERLKKEIFQSLEIIRVYTKPPNREIDKSHPFVLKRGSKIIELASGIHRDFINELKFVRLWREGEINGMRIDRDEVLEDGDIVEFHTR
ncbi:MAG: TGS domain-containing protein [Candidatus Cloacimonadota bacterium]|nr:MAG: TGS domain-containing protein [Candidatus Cloacimonadota bacterium]